MELTQEMSLGNFTKLTDEAIYSNGIGYKYM